MTGPRSAMLVLTLFTGSFACAQLPLLRSQGSRFQAGYILTVPVTGEYFDHSVTRGTDYFWEYSVQPRAGSGFFAGLSRMRIREFEKSAGFLEYGAVYHYSSSGIRYSGWEGGGTANVFYYGEGTRTWTDHYLSLDLSLTHHFFLGARQHDVLNSLCFSVQGRILRSTASEFRGVQSNTWGNVPWNTSIKNDTWIFQDADLPRFLLSYEFQWAIRTRAGAFCPSFRTSLINFSVFVPSQPGRTAPLERKKEYYKDFQFGISWIPSAVND